MKLDIFREIVMGVVSMVSAGLLVWAGCPKWTALFGAFLVVRLWHIEVLLERRQ